MDEKRVEDAIEELLKWQKDLGVSLVDVRDPDGKPTYDKDGSRVRQYNLAGMSEIAKEIVERAKSDPFYYASRSAALERAAKEVIEEQKRKPN